MHTNVNKILIVDGSNLLFQMFFGMPARIYNAQGIGIWGVLGFVGALLKIIRLTNPTHLTVLFDGEHENERTAIDSDYKANRTDYSDVPDEENPYSQLPYIYQALDYLGIAYAETGSCEVDDWVAGYAKCYGSDNEMIISSFDSDFFQLITDRVSVLRYRGEKTIVCTPEYIKEKFGIAPGQYAGFKSLTGDTTDNIKGADKVGRKTAARLMNEFSTFDNLLANAERIEKPSIKESIMKNTERLKKNYQIIRLGHAVPLPFALQELEYSDNGITTTEVLKGIGLK